MTGSNSTGYTVTEIDVQIDTRSSTVPPTVTLVKLSPTGANPVTLQSPASMTPNSNDIKVTYTAPVGTPLDASALYFVTITHSSNSLTDTPYVSRDTNDSETGESSGWSIDNAYKSRPRGGTTYTDNSQGLSALIAVRGTINTSSNNAPTFTDTTLMRNVAENTAADTNIGAAIPAATDVDSDALTYTMEGTNAASFTFDATTRQIKTKAALDFENKDSYSVTIKADDGNGGADTVDVTISVTNVDETPLDCDSGNSNEIWCVGLAAGSFGRLIGYASGLFGSISESDTSFTYNGTNYTVSRFSEDLVAGYRSLSIYLSPVNSSTLRGDHRLIVHVGSSVISFGDFTLAGDFSYVTGITNALLSNGVTTTVKLIVNAPPTASNGTVTMDEDTEYAFAVADFNYSDPEGDALSSITITTLPANGALTLSGSAVSVNDEVTMVQLTNGDLKYAPPADANGDAYASFTFKVNDGKGDSAAAYTMTINVTALADPPAAPRGRLTAETGDGRVRLVWTAPSDNGGAAITGYQFRSAQGASVPTGTAWSPLSRDPFSLTLLADGLTNGAAHAFEVRTVNRVGGGAAATVSATPAAGCSPPSLGSRRSVWSGTMTVWKTSPDSPGLTWGSTQAGFATGSGSLTQPRHFSIGATRYDITTLLTSVRDDGVRRTLSFQISSRLPDPVEAALQLHSCGETRDFSDTETGDNIQFSWAGRSLNIDFSIYPTRQVALSLPPNNAATGAPTIVGAIAGKVQVGQTLTASAGTVADDDGLPSALNYKWYRVDGSNVEMEIDGATGTTYTPAAADLHHTLKVKVSFYDDLGGEEVRESLETPTVQPILTIVEASATEGSALTFTVTLSTATNRAVTVNWAVSTSGGNTASTNDLSGTTSGTLTFAANATSQTITLNTVSDEIYEADETFTVTLSGPSNAVLGTQRAATGTIFNDEALPTMTLELDEVTIRESDDPNQSGNQHWTMVTATLDTPVEGEMRITIESGPELRFFASGDTDRTRLTIPSGEKTSDSVVVRTFLDNNVDEPDRTAVITATRANIPDGTLRGTQIPRAANPSLTITDDDDAPTVTLMLAPASVRESDDTSSTDVSEDESTVTASLSHPSSEATTVTVSAAAVSPAAAGDFTLSGNRVLTIPARETRSTGTVTVTANDNNVDAADKDVTVSAAAANTQGIAGNPPDLTLMIRDDEETPKVALVLGANSIDEDAGSTTVKATIPYPSSHATVVTITAAPGDFTVSGTLTISAGQTESGTATLTAVDNETDAEDKTVTVLATAVNVHGIVNPDGIQLTIEDDDPAPVVTLLLTSSPIDEDGGSTTVTASVDRPSSKPTMVTVSAAAVSPAVGGDFALSTNRTLAIAAGQTTSTGTVTITANDNNVDAPDKVVTVSGTAVNTQGIAQPADAPLTISDDELPPTVTLSLSRTATDEDDDEEITVTASLSHPSSEETTLTVSAAAVAPAVDDDFKLSGETLTISAGQTASTGLVGISTEDNETDAPDKNVTVSATVINTQGHEPGTPTGSDADDP